MRTALVTLVLVSARHRVRGANPGGEDDLDALVAYIETLRRNE
jgi:hypothetical protein